MKLRLAVALWLTGATAFAGSQVTATNGAVATASPIATKAGLDVLQRGGTAADAAVAIAFVLSATYPQSAPIGGGGHLLYYDAARKATWALDFTEVSPREATREVFGKAAPAGVRAAAVPGTVAGLDALHKRFGTRTWSELLAPAAAVAREGHAIDFALERSLAAAQKTRAIDKFTTTESLFFPEGAGLKSGAKLAQPELAATIDRLATQGAKDFYEGELARKLVDGVRPAGALISDRDLREYEPVWRAPIQLKVSGNDIFLAPPPAAGGFVIGSALQILLRLNVAATPFGSAEYAHLFIEATRRAFIDSARFAGDPHGTRLPYRELLSAERAALWAASVDRQRVTTTASLSQPLGAAAEQQNTTHFTVIDAKGNVVSATISLAGDFGSGFVVPGTGILLNAAMSNFGLDTKTSNGESVVTGSANLLDSKKRAAWSATPTIVVRDGRAVLAAGSAGGSRIASTMLQVLVGTLIYKKPLATAIEAARFHQQGIPEDVEYEAQRTSQPVLESLMAKGHPVAATETIGDVQAIALENGKITAVADPRHGGAAGGY